MKILFMVFSLIRCQERKVKLTYYWISHESDFPGLKTKHLKDSNGKTLMTINKKFYESIHMEGSGLLKNGKYVNCDDDQCTTFKFSNKAIGSMGTELNHFSSIAANDINLGTKVFSKDLQGVDFFGTVHNGCLEVVDRS